MSIGNPRQGQLGQEMSPALCLHPSVGTWAARERMSPRQKVAAVAKVRCLEHQLLEGNRVNRSLTRPAAESIVAEINELRRALGWLEIDLNGQWRWPHERGGQPEPARRVQLVAVASSDSRRLDVV